MRHRFEGFVADGGRRNDVGSPYLFDDGLDEVLTDLTDAEDAAEPPGPYEPKTLFRETLRKNTRKPTDSQQAALRVARADRVVAARLHARCGHGADNVVLCAVLTYDRGLTLFRVPCGLGSNVGDALAVEALRVRLPLECVDLHFYGAVSGHKSRNDEKLALLLRKSREVVAAQSSSATDDDDDDDATEPQQTHLPAAYGGLPVHDDELWLVDDANRFGTLAWKPLSTPDARPRDGAEDETTSPPIDPPADLAGAFTVDLRPTDDHLAVLPLLRPASAGLAVSGSRGVAAVECKPSFLTLYDCEDLEDDDDDDDDEEDDEDGGGDEAAEEDNRMNTEED